MTRASTPLDGATPMRPLSPPDLLRSERPADAAPARIIRVTRIRRLGEADGDGSKRTGRAPARLDLIA